MKVPLSGVYKDVRINLFATMSYELTRRTARGRVPYPYQQVRNRLRPTYDSNSYTGSINEVLDSADWHDDPFPLEEIPLNDLEEILREAGSVEEAVSLIDAAVESTPLLGAAGGVSAASAAAAPTGGALALGGIVGAGTILTGLTAGLSAEKKHKDPVIELPGPIY